MPRTVFLVATSLSFLMIGGWSFSTPLFASPDEPAHVARAVSLVHGEIVGRPAPYGLAAMDIPRAYRVVPGCLNCYRYSPDRDAIWPCYAFYPEFPASCQLFFHGSARVRFVSGTGFYPPFYYGIVGLPSLAVTTPDGIYAMRLVADLFCSVLIGLSVMSIWRWSKKRILFLGLIMSVTPMTLFMAGTVNPSGLEISAGLCLWCSALIVAFEWKEHSPRGLAIVMTFAAGVLLLCRSISPIWVALTFILFGLLMGRRSMAELLRRSDVRLMGLVLSAITAFALVWVALNPQVSQVRSGIPVPSREGDWGIIVALLAQAGGWFRQLVGIFGWLDTPAPLLTYLVWATVIAFIVVVAILVGRLRERIIFLVFVALVLGIPLAFGYAAARSQGLNIWQSRYVLPFAVGIPLFAAAMIDGVTWLRRIQPAFAIVVSSALAVASYLAFGESIRRYAVGVNGPIDFVNGRWTPPLGDFTELGLYLVCTIAFYYYMGRLTIGERRLIS